jgi:hypothetical protein
MRRRIVCWTSSVTFGEGLPFSEAARLYAVARRLFCIMDIVARPALSGAAIFLEDRFQNFKFVGIGMKMREVRIAVGFLFGNLGLHPCAVIAVQAVAFDGCSQNAFPPENLLEDVLDRSGPGP